MNFFIRYLPKWCIGIVTFTVEVAWLPLVLEIAREEKIDIWSLNYVSKNHVTFKIFLVHALYFMRLVHRQNGRVKILRREGAPYLWRYVLKRKFFWLSSFLSFGIFWFLISIIWQVEIEGTDAINPHKVRKLLWQEGVYIGQFRYRVPQTEQLLHRLKFQLPEAAWIGLRMEGVKFVITVIEKKHVIRTPSRNQIIDTSGNISAKRGAMVREIIVERGNPLVDVRDIVQKSQVLISAYYGDPKNPNSMVWVGARGRVMGDVWYNAEVHIPSSMIKHVYTGQRQKQYFPYFGDSILRLPMPNLPYEKQRIFQRAQPLYLGPWQLPFGFVEEEYLEVEERQIQYTSYEVTQLGKQRAREAVLKMLGPEGHIVAEKILHQRLERGKVVLFVHFDATENIAVAQSGQ